MDVSDLLAYKPEALKRKNEDEEDEDEIVNKKRRDEATPRPNVDEKILAMIENDNEDEEDVLDEMGLKKLALLFEKRILSNQKMRLKYPDDAKKFMESEMELHESIQKLQALATVPDLYGAVSF